MNRPSNVIVHNRETVFRGYLRLDRYRLRHDLYAGGQSNAITREVIERGHVAAVLPIDPRRDSVVLIEQFRPGAMAGGWQPWLTECVAGVIEDGERAEDVARREAEEEAGCAIDRLLRVHRFLSTPGVSSETVDLFCGRTDSNGIEGIYGIADEGEDVRASVVPVDHAIALLDDGAVVNAITIIALQWLARHYHRLKREWVQEDNGPNG